MPPALTAEEKRFYRIANGLLRALAWAFFLTDMTLGALATVFGIDEGNMSIVIKIARKIMFIMYILLFWVYCLLPSDADLI